MLCTVHSNFIDIKFYNEFIKLRNLSVVCFCASSIGDHYFFGLIENKNMLIAVLNF